MLGSKYDTINDTSSETYHEGAGETRSSAVVMAISLDYITAVKAVFHKSTIDLTANAIPFI